MLYQNDAVLDAFGLTAEQLALYEFMLSRPPMSRAAVAEITASQGWDLPVSATLRQLQSLGLVARMPSDPPTWAVVAPERALNALFLAREQVLAAARRRAEELMARFHSGAARCDVWNLVEVVYSQEAILERFGKIQRDARHEVCVWDGPPYATTLPAQSHPVNSLELELLGSGVAYRVVYNPAGIDRPGRLADLQVGIAAGEQARVGEVPTKLFMSDQKRALLPLHRTPTDFASGLWIEESTLVDALQELFEMHWHRAIPLRVTDEQQQPQDGATGPTVMERNLLSLLVAGLSDAAIARQMHLTARTVHRHVHRMMVKLNVETRFQAGYQAVLRGWIGDLEEGR